MIHNPFFSNGKGVFGFDCKRLPTDGAVIDAKAERCPEEFPAADKKRPSVTGSSILIAALAGLLLVASVIGGIALTRRNYRSVTEYTDFAGRISGVGTRIEVAGTVRRPGRESGQFTCLLEQNPGQLWKLYSEEPLTEGSSILVRGSFLGTVTYNEKQENEASLPTIMVESAEHTQEEPQ